MILRGLGLSLLLAGCAGLDDPYKREGTWSIEHVNDVNLAAQVADPRQLFRGVGEMGTPGALSAAAVRRLLADQVKPLPAQTSSGIALPPTPPPAPAAPAPAAAEGS